MKSLALLALAIVGLNASAQSFTNPMDCLTQLRAVSAPGPSNLNVSVILPDGKDSILMRYGSAELVSGADLSHWNTTITVIGKGSLGKDEPRSVGLNANGTASELGAPTSNQKGFESTSVSAGDPRIAEALKAELLRVGAGLSDQQKGRVYERCRTMPEVTAGLPPEWRDNQPKRPVADTDGIFGREGNNMKRDTLRKVDEIMGREPARSRDGSFGDGMFSPRSNSATTAR